MSASKQDLNTNRREIANSQTEAPTEGDTPIRVNGFEQVLQMLQSADPDFRESLLRRMGARDPKLVATLRRDLRNSGY